MDERTRKFYEEYILTNENYVEKELYPLEDIVMEKHRVLFSTKYGNIKALVGNLKRKGDSGIGAAVNKTEYFKNLLKDKNPETFELLIFKDEYKTAKEHMVFGTKYGDIRVTPSNLLVGKAPNIDSALNKTEYIINQFIEVHGDKYDYSLVEYINAKTKVKIVCKKHGVFEQTPSNHIKGKNCSRCSRNGVYGVKKIRERNKEQYKNTPAKLYILEFNTEEESFFKIGVTKHSMNSRIKDMSPYSPELIKVLKVNLYDAIVKEQELLDYFEEYEYTPKHKFGGHTECISINPLEELKIELT